jgi:hypothetical protein
MIIVTGLGREKTATLDRCPFKQPDRRTDPSSRAAVGANPKSGKEQAEGSSAVAVAVAAAAVAAPEIAAVLSRPGSNVAVTQSQSQR